ncbi:cold-shock domain-contain protein [Alcanivorax sp. S71-1-4]|uniref:cold shock domain-containing protein CspD n=1 Tax=Alcanivorax sp. S71-1-4 TaxID=1177159 RepID=UPI00135B18D6|nr:cold shock domain-containing protein CspD [Alcanivorax sp. S71-1-4]KAF0810390.1 cold-shock domain-contain protein [Alcanivorax sp. S71-1-4]
MATGKVKWFNNAKGYGFIRPDAGGEDLFVHYSYIQMDGYRSLKAGQPVEYELQQANKGYHAVNLRPAGNGEAEDGMVDAMARARSPVTEH